MIKYILTLLIVVLSLSAKGQSITYSPVSVSIWGEAENVRSIEFEYKGVKAIHLNTPYDMGSTFGIGYVHPMIQTNLVKFNLGGVLFNKKIFKETGSAINIYFELEFMIIQKPFDMSISYRHISNGFIGETNLGLDNLGLKFYFN